MTSSAWEVELSEAAQNDLREIVRWTTRQFGRSQGVAYGQLLRNALDALRAGPEIVGVRRRDDIGVGYFVLHAARNRRRARHFILFRVTAGDRVINVVRILHDAMDPARHIPTDAGEA